MAIPDLEEELLVVSRERVINYGEVYTPRVIVNQMLDLVAEEASRIDSRFLDPACGHGNFLIEVLRRKLATADRLYCRDQLTYQRAMIMATCNVYGIDILKDNVEQCRERLLNLLIDQYRGAFGETTELEWVNSAKFILRKNIIWGDTLTLATVGPKTKPIVVSEWIFVNDNDLKRRDFYFKDLLNNSELEATSSDATCMKEEKQAKQKSEYAPIFFLRVAQAKRKSKANACPQHHCQIELPVKTLDAA